MLTLLACLAPSPVPASLDAPAPDVDFATLVPESALLVFLGDDLGAMRARAETNAWWRLLQDPAFVELLETLRANDDYKSMRDEIGMDPMGMMHQAFSLIDDVAFFLEMPTGMDGKPLSTVLVRHSTEPKALEAAEQLLKPFLTAMDEQGEAVAYRDGQRWSADGIRMVREPGLLVVTGYFNGEEPLAEGEDEASRSTALDSRLDAIFAKLDGAGDGALGGGAALTDTSAWLASRSEADLALELFFDVGAMMNAMAYDADLPEEGTQVFENAGLVDMGRAHLAFDAGAGERLDYVGRIELGANSALDRVLAFGNPVDLELLKRVPAEVLTVSLWSFDVLGAYTEILEMVEEFDPTGGDARSAVDVGLMMAEMELGVGLEEVLELFTGDMASFGEAADLEDIDSATFAALIEEGVNPGMGTVLLFETVDGEMVQGVIADLLDAAELEAELVSTVGDVEVFSIDANEPLFTWAVQDDVLYFSIAPGTLDTALALVGSPDAATAATARMFTGFEELSKGALSAGMIENAGTAKQVLSLMEGVGQMIASEEPEAAELINSLPWPDLSIVDAYLKGRTESRAVRVGSVFEFAYRSR